MEGGVAVSAPGGAIGRTLNGMDKQVRVAVLAALREGFRAEVRKSGVIQLFAPDGISIVTVHPTGHSRGHAPRATIADLRRAGARLEGIR